LHPAPEDVRRANPAAGAYASSAVPSRDRLDVHLSRIQPAQMRIDPVVRRASQLESWANVVGWGTIISAPDGPRSQVWIMLTVTLRERALRPDPRGWSTRY
jgi:hypothetical protein